MAGKKDHMHTYIVAKRPGESKKKPREKLFICQKSNCGAIARGWQLEGKIGKCNECGNSMEYTYDALKRAKPICKACIERANSDFNEFSTPVEQKRISTINKLFGKTVLTMTEETEETGESNHALESIPDLETLDIEDPEGE